MGAVLDRLRSSPTEAAPPTPTPAVPPAPAPRPEPGSQPVSPLQLPEPLATTTTLTTTTTSGVANKETEAERIQRLRAGSKRRTRAYNPADAVKKARIESV